MKLPFESEYRKLYYMLLDEIFDSNFWSDGKMTKRFEEEFSKFTGIEARSIVNCGAGLLATMEYIDVKGKDVLVPANTFWATTQAVRLAGGNVIYVDCNKEDLCISYEDMIRKMTPNVKTVVVVHIGGHIAFDIQKIAAYCNQNNIFLVEDCAHVHGATWDGKTGGHWGFAGCYSFYATKTMPTGEGGAVVSRDKEFLSWLEKYRNYGKQIIDGTVTYPIKDGFNYRISEFTAALGIVQLQRLPRILEWKRSLAQKYDRIFDRRVRFPEKMVSGYYKYIVFDYDLNEQTGKVFAETDLGYNIENLNIKLPNTEWVARHHSCPPIYYGWEKADFSTNKLIHYLL